MFRPRLETLEDRSVPAAQFGVTWADPTHLKASFVPDGTLAGDVGSAMPVAWRNAVYQAIQAWSNVSNVNIGLMSDSGLPLGTPGFEQGDSRFGDLRFGAVPLGGDALGVAVPPGPFLQGTLAGDVVFNTGARFTARTLLSTALHEVGHALGIPPSRDPRSVMFNRIRGNITLTAGDIAAVRTLYGARAHDDHEGRLGNRMPSLATRIIPAESFDGATPLVVYGDVTVRGDLDHYLMTTPQGYTGPVTFHLHTAGISLLQPRLTVYAGGRVVGQASGLSGSTLTLNLPSAATSYVVRVEGVPRAYYAIGRYGLGVTYDEKLSSTELTLAEVLSGPYSNLSQTALQQLFLAPDAVLYDDEDDDDDDDGGNDVPDVLLTERGYAVNSLYRTQGTVQDSSDLDTFEIRTPNLTNRFLTVRLRSAAANGVLPNLELVNENGAVIPTTVLAWTAYELALQTPVLPRNSIVRLRISGEMQGNYEFEARYTGVPARMTTFASGALPTGGAVTEFSLYVARTQLLGLTLDGGVNPVRMTILDESDTVVQTITTPGGQSRSAFSTLLAPGEYRVRFESEQATTFTLRGATLTDPLGPIKESTLYKPQYEIPTIPNMYIYPTMYITPDPYYWLLMETRYEMIPPINLVPPPPPWLGGL